MPSYTDPLAPLMAREHELLEQIGQAISAELGRPVHDLEALVQEAIADWATSGEEEYDLNAFRPLSALQKLLVEHRHLEDIIAEALGRRLG